MYYCCLLMQSCRKRPPRPPTGPEVAFHKKILRLQKGFGGFDGAEGARRARRQKNRPAPGRGPDGTGPGKFGAQAGAGSQLLEDVVDALGQLLAQAKDGPHRREEEGGHEGEGEGQHRRTPVEIGQVQTVQEGDHRVADRAAALDGALLGGVDGRVMRRHMEGPLVRHKKHSFRTDRRKTPGTGVVRGAGRARALRPQGSEAGGASGCGGQGLGGGGPGGGGKGVLEGLDQRVHQLHIVVGRQAQAIKAAQQAGDAQHHPLAAVEGGEKVLHDLAAGLDGGAYKGVGDHPDPGREERAPQEHQAVDQDVDAELDDLLLGDVEQRAAVQVDHFLLRDEGVVGGHGKRARRCGIFHK